MGLLVGVEKTQPPTDTTSLTWTPETLETFVNVVAALVWMVMINGAAKLGAAPAAVGGGTRKPGFVARRKLSAGALTDDTVPVIGLGSKLMLLAVSNTSGGPTGQGVLLLEAAGVATELCITTTCTV